jgi:hypothetical protein
MESKQVPTAKTNEFGQVYNCRLILPQVTGAYDDKGEGVSYYFIPQLYVAISPNITSTRTEGLFANEDLSAGTAIVFGGNGLVTKADM